ncbi:MAG TPA: glycosyltransferase family 4 protein, partial [Bdellovibrionales bacterium]|nr:glycosyltransferase family 4 protein [Bdellovibrionales bacterium]
MRILMVSPTLFEPPKRVGGGERYVEELAAALSRRPEVAKVKVLGFSGGRYDRVISPKLSVHSYDALHHNGNPFNPYFSPRAFSHNDWDVLYLHQFHTWLTPAAIAWAKLLGRKIVLTDHNGGGATLNRKLRLDRQLDALLATSRISAEDLALRPKRTEIIYGGVDTDAFAPPAGETAREGFLFVGRALRIKGLEELLAAAGQARRAARLTLLLWADGSTREYVRKLRALWQELEPKSKMTVRFVTEAGKSELLRNYQSHDWTVLPSRDEFPRECLGLTALEGLSCGTAAAVSRFTGASELASAYPSPAFQVVEDWTRFFETAAGGRDLFRAARAWALEHASWDAVARNVVRVFEELAGAKR